MNKNPFTSGKFPSVWLEHFRPDGNAIRPGFVPDLSFVRSNYLPFYSNVGSTHSKGIAYTLSKEKGDTYKKKVFLIYDVPAYFDVDVRHPQKHLRLYTCKQYPGFLIDLKSFSDLNDYLMVTHSKSSRSKFRKFKRRLELCFDIEYKMYFGDISKADYDFIFENFRLLLEKRFSDKQITNNNLDPQEWEFYKAVAYPLILEKKAALFVVYDESKPIGVTLNYTSDKQFFDAITVFDIEYSKFHLGSVMLMELIDFSIEHGFEIFDFSKGHFEYKQRWASKSYDFEYHIYYDAQSIKSRAIATALKTYFDTKQFLRERRINEKFHKLTFWLKNRSNRDRKKKNYIITEIENDYDEKALREIVISQDNNALLKPIVFDFLYLNSECYKDLKVYKVQNKKSSYLLYGKNKKVEVAFENVIENP